MTGGAGPVLLAASHGTASSSGQQAIAALVAEVAMRMPETEIATAYVDVQAPDVPSALARVAPGRPVIIVPLLLSAGYHVHVDLARAAAGRAGTRVAAPLGPDPRLADLLAHRVRSAQTVLPETVILAAAGSSDPRAIEDCRTMADALSQRLRHPVTTAFLSSGTPSLEDARQSAEPGAVIVASYLLAPGAFHDAAIARAAPEPVTPALLDGDRVPAELVEIVADRYRALC